MEDFYARDKKFVAEPPKSFWNRLRYLGPSLILTANVVGSGELIVTTSLGAKAGFVTLWVVLVSCIAKVAIQLEFGKHAIRTGYTTMEAFDKLSGPSIKGTNWTVYVWTVVKSFQLVQYGGIIGGVALALNIAFPAISVVIWALVAGFLTIILTVVVKYDLLEKFSIFLVAAFSLFTIYCVLAIQTTEFSLSVEAVLSGLKFDLPPEVLGFAMAMFAITGVGADEIISYPYWCIEKGYARFTGPKQETEDWYRRARGWIRVMYLDGAVSLLIYTTTVAFYLLGATILHQRSVVPAGYDMIKTISTIYTESVGPGAMVVYLAGAIITLFSTLFVASISATRMFLDAFGRLRWLKFDDPQVRKMWFQRLGVLIPIIWTVSFVAIKLSVLMITIGALSLSFLLLIVLFAAVVFKFHEVDNRLKSGFV
uniref:MS111 n=1 Tax=Microscilla sp. PRE1 TaxID=155537 RepID=Q93PB8_9BACT|nr:Nramp family divalent metal transporter [Microscilla sp. PRE1]AAK62833.1 MS111 [Microscilla sp. PRE1]